ncbi:MAG: RidA family protein [Vicingaceae bacterium]|nr:RidA family protein [Vicingaceae bacterium]
MRKKTDTTKAPKPMGLYPYTKKAGNLLFLSGVGPRAAGSGSEEANIPGLRYDKNGNYDTFDFEAQCRSVFENVQLILEEAGATWNDLVDVTVFLTDMKRDFKTYNKVYAEYFKENQPCRTTVEVGSLPSPIAIELKCIAYLK